MWYKFRNHLFHNTTLKVWYLYFKFIYLKFYTNYKYKYVQGVFEIYKRDVSTYKNKLKKNVFPFKVSLMKKNEFLNPLST